MSDDMSSLLVFMDGTDSQQLTLSSDINSSVAIDESMQTVYVTSLLLVEPKPAQSKKNRVEQVVGDDLKVEDRLQVLDAMLPPPTGRTSRRMKCLDSRLEKEDFSLDYKCELCSSTFEQPEQYFGHLQTHSGEHVWECSLCPSSQSVFETLSKLRQHEKVKHFDSQSHSHQCSLCPASYERISQLEYHHRRVHIEEKNHVCQLCNKGFYKRSDLRTHLGVHLGLQSRVCEICGQSFSHVSNLNRHARLHSGVKPYPCSTCGRRFAQLPALEEHRLIHLSDRPAFPCPAGLCSREFRSRQIALRHARRLHAEAPIIEHIPKAPVKPQRRYHCAVCGKAFEKANALHLHENEHQDYTCSWCNESFLGIADLKAHGCSGEINHLFEETEGLDPAGRIPEDIDSAERIPENMNPAERNPEDIDPAELISEDIPSAEQVSEDIDPAELISNDIVPAELISNDIVPAELISNDIVPAELISEDIDSAGQIPDIDPVEQIPVEDIDLIERIVKDANTNGVENGAADQQDVPVSLETFLIGDILVCIDNGTLKIASSEEFSSNSFLRLTSEGSAALSPADIEESQSVIATLPITTIGDIPDPTVSTKPHLSSISLSSPKEVFAVNFPECQPSLSPPLPSPALVSREPDSPPVSLLHTPSPPTAAPNPPTHSSNPLLVDNSINKIGLPRVQRAPSQPVLPKTSGGTCSECGKHFRKTSNLKQHMGIHFADKQIYRCHLCSHTFSWKSSLNKHLVRHFPELRATQKAVCHDCGKEYLTPAQVNEHLRRDHLLERSHTCDLCPKAFYKKHDLATHMRVHTKEKPYMCGTCGKTFTHISHVKRHELIHRGVKRYECDICKARFRQSSGLKAHVRRYHSCSGPNVITDELCDFVDDESES